MKKVLGENSQSEEQCQQWTKKFFHSQYPGPASPPRCCKAVTGAEDRQTLFVLTSQRDTEFWQALHKHASLGRKTSPAVLSFGLLSVTSLHRWRSPSSQLTKTTKACLQLRLSAYPPTPQLDPPHWEFKFTCQAMNLHRQQQSWKRQVGVMGTTHQSIPETFPCLPQHKTSISDITTHSIRDLHREKSELITHEQCLRFNSILFCW